MHRPKLASSRFRRVHWNPPKPHCHQQNIIFLQLKNQQTIAYEKKNSYKFDSSIFDLIILILHGWPLFASDPKQTFREIIINEEKKKIASISKLSSWTNEFDHLRNWLVNCHKLAIRRYMSCKTMTKRGSLRMKPPAELNIILNLTVYGLILFHTLWFI